MAMDCVSHSVRTSERLRDGIRAAEESLDISRAEVGGGLLCGDEHREQQCAGDSDNREHVDCGDKSRVRGREEK